MVQNFLRSYVIYSIFIVLEELFSKSQKVISLERFMDCVFHLHSKWFACRVLDLGCFSITVDLLRGRVGGLVWGRVLSL